MPDQILSKTLIIPTTAFYPHIVRYLVDQPQAQHRAAGGTEGFDFSVSAPSPPSIFWCRQGARRKMWPPIEPFARGRFAALITEMLYLDDHRLGRDDAGAVAIFADIRSDEIVRTIGRRTRIGIVIAVPVASVALRHEAGAVASPTLIVFGGTFR